MVTVTDAQPFSSVVNLPLTVAVGNDVWNGSSSNDDFRTGLNWTNHLAPGYVGDSLELPARRSCRRTWTTSTPSPALPLTAGRGPSPSARPTSSTLTLAGGLVNNSVDTETLNVPITFNSAQTIDAAAGNLALGGVISGTGERRRIGSGTLTLSATGDSLSGIVGVTGGTLSVAGSSTAFGTGLSYHWLPRR